jgi:hypothetical protein
MTADRRNQLVLRVLREFSGQSTVLARDLHIPHPIVAAMDKCFLWLLRA